MSGTAEWIFRVFEVLQAIDGSNGQAVQIETTYWATQDKSVIEMRLCGRELCGYLVSETLVGEKKESVCGLPILLGLKPESERKWAGGWIIDPDNGWAFNAKAKFKKNGKLVITAFENSELLSEKLRWVQTTRDQASCFNKNDKAAPHSFD